MCVHTYANLNLKLLAPTFIYKAENITKLILTAMNTILAKLNNFVFKTCDDHHSSNHDDILIVCVICMLECELVSEHHTFRSLEIPTL